MRILIDTNVLLDVALAREAFFADSARVLDWAERHPGQAAIAWHSVSNFAYLVKRDARAFLSELLTFVEVAAGDTATVRHALALPTRDLEDALQTGAALEFGAALIVTRNPDDYLGLPVTTLTPTAFVAAYLAA